MAEIKVTGVGTDLSVQVEDGASIEVVLGEAGINAEEVNVTVDGQKVTPETPVTDGQAVTTTPKAAALG